jgi:hypothetical protein
MTMGDGKISFKVDGSDFEIDESLKDWAIVGCGGERWLGLVSNMVAFDVSDAIVDLGVPAVLRPGIELASLAQTVAVVTMHDQHNRLVPKEGMQAIYDGLFPLNKLSLHEVRVRWTSMQLCREMSHAARALCLGVVRYAVDRAQGKDTRVQQARPGGIIPSRQ